MVLFDSKWGLQVVLLCAVTFSAFRVSAGTVSEARPFRFRATITQVEDGFDSLGLPLSIAVGQELTGLYSFGDNDPYDTHRSDSLRLDFEGKSLYHVVNFGFASKRGSGFLNRDPESNGGDSTNTTVRDAITLFYFSPTDAAPGWSGFGLGVHNNATIALAGPEGVLEDGTVPDIGNWNQFSDSRHLLMQFGYPETFSVRATLGDFIAVPEPALLQLMCSAALVLLFARSSRETLRCRSKRTPE